jgi:cyclic dehypoxanthinyl futalosine synthase
MSAPTKSEATPSSAPPGTPPEWTAPLESRAQRGVEGAEIRRIAGKIEDGGRLTAEEALTLHERADLGTLGRLADLVRWRLNPDPVVTYIVDRNVNPTNVCVTDCGFCAFYRGPKHEEAYTLSREQLHAKYRELDEIGGRQVLMQGGHHHRLGTEWCCEMLRDLRESFPRINPHALSAPEIDHLSILDKRPVEEVIAQLVEAGLGSVPGAGAEILNERVRKIIAPRKTSTDRWIEVHRRVHEAGLRSSATMMFGHVETPAERIEHLARIRDLQDDTGGFTAFASWNMQPEGVPQQHLFPNKTTPAVYLRVQAIARLFLDNVQHMQTSYVTQGMKLAQVTLRWGCDDFGGTMMEENVVSAAGCFHLEAIDTIERMIRSAGYTPRRRNSWYGIDDERHDGPPRPASAAEAAPRAREATA